MVEKMLKDLLNKPLVITPEQLDNILIYCGETEKGIETTTIEDYLTLKIVDKLLTLLKRGE